MPDKASSICGREESIYKVLTGKHEGKKQVGRPRHNMRLILK
jgi:hypothetical protein